MSHQQPARPSVGETTRLLTIDLLGTPRLRLAVSPLRLAYLKAEALLYYLAVTGRAHSRLALAALLWGQAAERQARNSLRNALYTIRHGLESLDPLLIERDTIRVDPTLLDLDVTRFKQAIDRSQGLTPLAEALALWRGHFMTGVSLPDAPLFEEWLAEQRAAWLALYQQGLFHLAERYRTEQRLTDARRTIETLLTLDPTHEAAHQLLMRIYVQLGNRAAALRQYESLRSLLVEELGIDPDPTTQALHLELLQADTLLPPAPPLSVSPAPKSPGRYRFIGRQRELKRLDQIYQTTLPAGPARLVILEGEPGIGKTRLAQEWLASLTETRRLTSRCFETEQTIPFQPWIDLIRTSLTQPSSALLDLPDVWLIELAQLVPEIRLHRPDLAPPPPAEPELARGRLIQAIGHWLESLCQERSLCLFIDDCQWLDQASLTLLRYLLRPQVTGLPLLILGAQREGETMSGWPQLKSHLERDGLLHHLPLQRLAAAEVIALARSIGLPDALPPDTLLKGLLRETEGNPLFIIEMMHSLPSAEAMVADPWPLPQTIQDVIHSRLSRLSQAGYHLLAAAAVLGRVFTGTDLQQISDGPPENTLHIIEEALAANLITEQAEAYDFTHDKIRAVLLDSLTRSRRRHLHRRVAEALEARLSNDFGLLSYHFEAGGDPLRARNYGLRVARQAVELYADEDALTWYDKVETLCTPAPAELSAEAIPKVTPFQQVYVSRRLPLDVLGLVYRQRGLIRQRIGDYDEAEAAFQAALRQGQQRARLDEQAAAHNLLSFLAYLRSDYDGVGDHAQQALDLATAAGEAALRAPGLRHLGIAIYRTADYERASALYDEALDAYRLAGDRLGMAGVYNNIGFVLRTQAHYNEAIAAFQEALAIYEAMGQVEGSALIHSNIGRTYAFSGDLAQAEQVLRRGLALSEEAHTDWITVKIHRTLGNVCAQSEQWTAALKHARQARALAESLGSDEDLGATLRLLAEIAAADPTAAAGSDPTAYFEQSIALLQQVGAQDELDRAKAAFAAFRGGA